MITIFGTHYAMLQRAYKNKEKIYHGLRLQSIHEKKCYNGKNTANEP